MVPAEKIAETALRERPDLCSCLSGLITPSLFGDGECGGHGECEAGLDTAARRWCHHVAPALRHEDFSGLSHVPVVHVTDAAQKSVVASKLLNPEQEGDFVTTLERE